MYSAARNQIPTTTSTRMIRKSMSAAYVDPIRIRPMSSK